MPMAGGPTQHRMNVEAESTPKPDPTFQTTQQLTREIDCLREILDARREGQRSVFEARFDGMDKALMLLQTIFDRLPNDIHEKVAQLQSLHQEKFASIQTQFEERDTRTEQTSRDSKVAVDAALQAAKEAVGEQNKSSALAIAKSETSTNKQIDQLGLLIQTGTQALKDMIDDIKTRVTRVESEEKGQKTAQTTQQTSNTSMVAIIGLVIGAIVGIGGILIGFIK